MVIALWQAVPVGVDKYGRTRLGIGVGAGQLEYFTTDCDGNVVNSQHVGYKNIGAQAEHWVVPGKVLMRAAASHQSSDSASASGFFGALTLGREWQKFGIGLGAAVVPTDYFADDVSSQVYPSFYIRVGNRDRIHFRTDFDAPTDLGPNAFFRMLLMTNEFDSHRPSGGGGITAFGPDGAAAFMGEYFRPVTPNTMLGITGFFGPGRKTAQGGVCLRARFTLK